jgi:hypothetical protein
VIISIYGNLLKVTESIKNRMNEKLVVLFTEPCNRIRSDMRMSSSMDKWVGVLNKNLSRQGSRDHIVEWFGNTDNFVLRTWESNLSEVKATFEISNKIKCTALSLSEIYFLIHEISLIPIRQYVSDLNLKLGAAFQIKGAQKYFDDFQIGLVLVRCFQRGIATIKMENVSQKLPFSWRRLNRVLDENIDGEWTSRSIRSLDGVFQRALQYFDNRKDCRTCDLT